MGTPNLGIQESFYAKNFFFHNSWNPRQFFEDKSFCGYNFVACFSFSIYFDKSETKALE